MQSSQLQLRLAAATPVWQFALLIRQSRAQRLLRSFLCAFLHLIAKASSCSHCFGNAQDSEAYGCLPFVILCTRHEEYLVW